MAYSDALPNRKFSQRAHPKNKFLQITVEFGHVETNIPVIFFPTDKLNEKKTAAYIYLSHYFVSNHY